ncbi:MAG: lipopolysaccharide biosynthesis protein [Cyclobacterium sp.]|uniref:lipopolysaccharide biosynthesis protein n=1 Tax=Cyclobacterium sp. TaxID=1966343 RepID=UPI003970853B
MSLKEKTLTGILWAFLQQFGAQLINFIVSVVLARWLMPAEFGIIGMISVFIAIGNSLVDSGLTSSLIRSKNNDQKDFSTVFFMNIFASIIIYLILFFCSPFIAKFFDQPILIPVVRVYCLVFIIKAFSAVQNARYTLNMDFKSLMIVTIPSLLIGGIVGLSFAYFGYGVWSLVYMNLVQAMLVSIQLWVKGKWMPTLVFDIDRLKYHFNFGYKLTLSGILNTIYDNIYHLIIGKFFSAAQLGYYTRAQSMKQLPVTNISSALNKVTYSMFSKIQDDDIRLKSAYKGLMQQVLFWITPTLIIAGILAEPLFRFLLTEKWLPAVPYFQILCIVGIMYPLHSYNLNILKVKGRSDLFLRLEVIKKVLISIGLFIAIPLGIYGLLWMQVILNILAFGINTYYSGRLINYPLYEQLIDILPIIGVSILAGIFLFVIDLQMPNLNEWDFVRLTVGCSVGMLFYLLFSYFIKLKALMDFKKLILKK